MSGSLLCEYSPGASPSTPQKEYAYRNGELLVQATVNGQVDFQWIVADHLGTSRMVIAKTGSLAGVKRHDYYPFGEEIFAPQGGRTAQQGYVTDNVRQKFTGYERDDETGLDFARARYYDSELGRFITPDPLLSSAYPTSPQSWNRYSYVMNQPMNAIDPSGLFIWSEELGGNLTDDQLRKNQCAAAQCTADEIRAGKRSKAEVDRIIGQRNQVREAIAYLKTLINSPLLSQAERSRLTNAINAYGEEGEANGVYMMGFRNDRQFVTVQMLGMSLVYLGNPANQHIMDFSLGMLHEGQHIVDYKNFLKGGSDLSQFQYEINGFVTEGIGAKAAMKSQGFYPRSGQLPANEHLWNPGWAPADVEQRRNSGATNRVTGHYSDPSGQPLSQTNQGPTMGDRERAVRGLMNRRSLHP